MIGSYMTGSSDISEYSLDIIQGNIHLVPIVLECSNLDSNEYSYPRLHFVHWWKNNNAQELDNYFLLLMLFIPFYVVSEFNVS